ncbi:NADPH dehydrogenase NamA [Virgibacillus soli]|uniref:NADPH dehydrogenase NamA n=1 Tax=Paracerasibacillus soli TaxID=480284 RepID=A0ABU5CPU8_9BACI|nr:NADPH dehydrogenase NamA [Virgibacillus soli]MDY0408376.1 NADPH dehydrogenase NamA [Virgibacillus soli]
MTKLFSPITFKNIELKNRLVMSPMCMYSCVEEDGLVTPFHQIHYGSRAIGQVGLVMVEATAVQPEGRISMQDLGIWSDDHIPGLRSLTEQIHAYGASSAIQLAHAGRKADVNTEIYAPTNIPFHEHSATPVAMTREDIKDTIVAFQQAAVRAKKAGFHIIEIHAAHGYLLNQFLSPLTNKRMDEYGGTLHNRMRLLEEVIQAIQTDWDGPIFVRLSVNEYDTNGNSINDFIIIAKLLKALGIHLIDCSSGGIIPVSVPAYPGYQVPYSEKLKHEANIATGAVGLITSGVQAEEILQNDRADLIFVGRTLLRNPYWAREAANELKTTLQPPTQYKRGWNI